MLKQVTNTRVIDAGANIFRTQLRLDDFELRTKVQRRPCLFGLPGEPGLFFAKSST